MPLFAPYPHPPRPFRGAVLLLSLCLLLGGAPGCKDGPAPPAGKSAAGGKAVAKLAKKKEFTVLHDMVNEVARAELYQGGLLINLGTPDQHKYTRAGWRTGWASTGGQGQTLFAVSRRYSKLLTHTAQRRVAAVVVRLRSELEGQEVTAKLDNKPLAAHQVGKEWRSLVFPVEPVAGPGPHTFTLDFGKPKSVKELAAEVDWVWFAETLPEADPQLSPGSLAKAGNRSFGRPAKALLADAPRQFSYYYPIGDKVELEFDYAADQDTTFRVCVSSDERKRNCVFEDRRGDGTWREINLPLHKWAGQVVRLDFISEGAGGKAAWANPSLVTQAPAARPPVVTPQNRAENLIHILIDTARQDSYVAFNPRSRVRTPAMTAFAKESVLFENAYNHDNWTKPSVATALSGLYSSSHTMSDNDTVLPKEVQIIPEHLQARGFNTAGFIANGFVSDKFGFQRGWNTYRNYIREGVPFDSEYVYADALRWLKKNRDKGRFYLYIQTFDPHVPYDVGPKYLAPYYEGTYKGSLGKVVSHDETYAFIKGKRKFTIDDKTYIKALYDGEINYHDDQFAAFFRDAAKLGILDDTLIVVSNDHGEEMFDHGLVGHWHTLYEELLRNPLVMHYPRLLPPGQRVKTLVGLVDLVPTMLDILGVPPMPQVEGVSLLPVIYHHHTPWGFYEVAEHNIDFRSVRVGKFKLIHHKKETMLFNLRRDPKEQQNLFPQQARIAQRACEIYLGEGLAVPNRRLRLKGVSRSRTLTSTKVKMDPKLHQQLKALGYIN